MAAEDARSNAIEHLRRCYESGVLGDESLHAEPLHLFGDWLAEAIAAGLDEPYAMTLATASGDGAPSARIVLLRGFDQDGFRFFTNYESAKAVDLAENPRAALLFHWQKLERQVRIEGLAEKLSAIESEAYFHSRPRGHQLAAWASPQSRILENREELERRLVDVEQQFPAEVPVPPFWGGYRVRAERIEFWQGRKNRLHDRLHFMLEDGGWRSERMAP